MQPYLRDNPFGTDLSMSAPDAETQSAPYTHYCVLNHGAAWSIALCRGGVGQVEV